MSSSIEKQVLGNGLTVLVDPCEQFASVVLVVCILGGQRDETRAEVGITHLLEHLLLKRTKQHTPLELATIIDGLGGDINAVTDSESLCLYGTVPAGRFLELANLFAELILEPGFTEADLGVEREVIKQEIIEASDDPEDATYQKFSELFWPDSQLGLPVFGSSEVLDKLQPADLHLRHRQLIQGKRILIAAAGRVKPETVLRFSESRFGALEPGDRPRFTAPNSDVGFQLFERPVNQSYLFLGTPWPALRDKRFLAGSIVVSRLGEGMSSRLFQLLREENGLAYSVGAEVDAHRDTGVMLITSVLESANVAKALSLIDRELRQIGESGFSDAEIAAAKAQLIAELQMEVDCLSSRAWRMIETELTFGRYLGVKEEIVNTEELRREEICSLIEDFTSKRRFMLVIGGDIANLELDVSPFYSQEK